MCQSHLLALKHTRCPNSSLSGHPCVTEKLTTVSADCPLLLARSERQIHLRPLKKREAVDSSLGTILPRLPTIVSIDTGSPNVIEGRIPVRPVWSLELPGRETLYVVPHSGTLPTFPAGLYYIPRRFRRGNWTCYVTSDEESIYAVRVPSVLGTEADPILHLAITTLFHQALATYIASMGYTVKMEHRLHPGAPPVDLFCTLGNRCLLGESKFSFSGELSDPKAIEQLEIALVAAKKHLPLLSVSAAVITNADVVSEHFKVQARRAGIAVWQVAMGSSVKKVVRDPRALSVQSVTVVSA